MAIAEITRDLVDRGEPNALDEIDVRIDVHDASRLERIAVVELESLEA